MREKTAHDLDLNVLWAKSVDNGEGSLSLVQHLRDVSSVIVPVSEKLLPTSRRKQLAENCGTPDLRTLLKFAAWSHDVGKASPFFQCKVPQLLERVLGVGYPAMSVSPQESRALPHSLISAYTVCEWFEARTGTTSPGCGMGWFSVLGGHHGVFPQLSFRPDGLVREADLCFNYV